MKILADNLTEVSVLLMRAFQEGIPDVGVYDDRGGLGCFTVFLDCPNRHAFHRIAAGFEVDPS